MEEELVVGKNGVTVGSKRQFPCTHKGCFKIFSNISIRLRHERRIHQQPTVESWDEDSASSFVANVNRTPGQDDDLRCTQKGCIRVFESKRARDQHLRLDHEGYITCPQQGCDKVVKLDCLSQHLKGVHQKVKKQCNVCKKWISVLSLSQHREICDDKSKKIFMCSFEDCNKTFITQRYLNAHLGHSHGTGIKCPRPGCDQYFTQSNLRRHIRNVHEKSEQLCKNCGKLIKYSYFSRHSKLCPINGERETNNK